MLKPLLRPALIATVTEDCVRPEVKRRENRGRTLSHAAVVRRVLASAAFALRNRHR